MKCWHATPALALACGSGMAVFLMDQWEVSWTGFIILGIPISWAFWRFRESLNWRLMFNIWLGAVTGSCAMNWSQGLNENQKLRHEFGSSPAWAELQGWVHPGSDEGELILELISWSRTSSSGRVWRESDSRILIRGPFAQVWNSHGIHSHKVIVKGLLRPVAGSPDSMVRERQALEWKRDGVVYELALSSWKHFTVLKVEETSWIWKLRSHVIKILMERRLWASDTLGRGLEIRSESFEGTGRASAVDLLRAMALGEKDLIDNESREVFQRVGVYHVFAISGLHVTIMTGIGVLVLRALRIPGAWLYQGSILWTWFYVALAGWQPSAIRAGIFWSVAMSSFISMRPYRAMNALGFAGWIMLMWDPGMLFEIGFQLSFLVTASLLIWIPRWSSNYATHKADLNWLDEKAKWSSALKQGIVLYLAFQIAAWIGSTPIILANFHRISPISILSNVIVFPCIGLILGSTIVSLSLATLGAPGVIWANHAAWVGIKILVGWCDWLDTHAPWGSIEIKAPILIWTLCWYFWLVLGWTDWGWMWVRNHWRLHMFLCAFTLSATWRQNVIKDPGEFRMLIFNCDSGDGAWVDLPGRDSDFMIDGCRINSWRSEALPSLRREGVQRWNRWVLTHGDISHYEACVEEFKEWQAVEYDFPDASHSSAGFRKFREALLNYQNKSETEIPIRVNKWKAGDWFRPGWRVLSPIETDPGEYRRTTADFSPLVLYVTPESNQAGAGILYMSDMDGMAQSAWLERYADLQVDVLIASFNSDGTLLKSNLLEALQPQWVIINSEKYPAYQRMPQKVKLRILKNAGIAKVLDTQELGTIEIKIHRRKLSIAPLREAMGF